MHITPALATAAGLLLALTLTACSSSEEPANKPAPASTTTTAAPATATAKEYTFEDCVALLDYDFTQGKPQDASKDPECAHLTPEQYYDAVAEVLTKHKDEILTPTPTP